MERFHVVVLGSGGVGKSTLTLRFTHNEFVDIYDPTIEETFATEVVVDGTHVLLEVLDTAGADQFSTIREFYLHGADGFILVYSLTSDQTLRDLEPIRGQVLANSPYDRLEIPMIAVGTKADLEDQRDVLPSIIQRCETLWNVPFFETSAKKDIGVTEAFHDLVRQMIRQRRTKRKSMNSHPTSDAKPHKHRRGCTIM